MWLPPPVGRGNPTHPPSKPSLQEASLNCTLRQVSPVAAPGSPQRLAASHGKRLVCRRRPLCVLLSFPHPGWGPAHLSPGRGPLRAPPSAGPSLMHPAAQIPPFSGGMGGDLLVQGCLGLQLASGARGQGHERYTRVWGCPAWGGGRAKQPLGVLFRSCCLLVEQLARSLPARRETNRRQVTSVRPPGPSATRRLFLCSEPEEKLFASCLRSRTPEQLRPRCWWENVPGVS